jgi:hypothetical protein
LLLFLTPIFCLIAGKAGKSDFMASRYSRFSGGAAGSKSIGTGSEEVDSQFCELPAAGFL